MTSTVRTPSAPAYCPVCGKEQARRTVEQFEGGRFAECAGCRVHFADAGEVDLTAYYRAVWGAGNLGCRPYQDKVEAAREPAALERLLREVPRFRWAVGQLRRLPGGARVLDVGCGEGAVLWAARRLGHDPHGCDLAPNAVEMARRLLRTPDVHAATIAGLPYGPGSFDCVLALEVLEHLPGPLDFVARAARLLKPDGVLLLTMPNRHRLFAVLKRALGRPHSNTDYPPHHLTRWSAGALRGLLGKHFAAADVGSLPYHFGGRAGRALARPLHLLTAGRMGQSLWARARRPRAAAEYLHGGTS